MKTKNLFLAAIATILPSMAIAEAPDPDTWYKDQYAPLWADKPWDKISEIVAYYPNDDGEIAESIAGWRAEEWVSSELTGYRSDHLNGTTSTFKVKWLDRYSDGSTESSCGWYLAEYKNDAWGFVRYEDIDCDAHEL